MDGGCPGYLTSPAPPTGPSLVGMVQKDWASQNSIALSWKEAEQPSLPVVDYEIKYYEKVQQLSTADTERSSGQLACNQKHKLCCLLNLTLVSITLHSIIAPNPHPQTPHLQSL